MDMIIGMLLIVSIIFIIIGIQKNLKISPTSNQIYEPVVVNKYELNKYSMFKDISAWMSYPF